MKKLTFPVLILLVAFSACAQNSHLDKFYRQYTSAKSDGDLSVDPNLLLSASFSGGGRTDGSWMHRITSVRCMLVDSKKTPDAGQEWADLSNSLRADHFEEWYTFRKGKSRVELLSRDGNPMEIACLLVGDDGGGLCFHLLGHFTAEDKARIEAALQNHENE